MTTDDRRDTTVNVYKLVLARTRAAVQCLQRAGIPISTKKFANDALLEAIGAVEQRFNDGQALQPVWVPLSPGRSNA